MLFLLLLFPKNRALTIIPNRALDHYRAIRYREDDFQVIFCFLLASCFFLAPPSICIYLNIAPKSEKFAEKRQSIFLSAQNDSSISQKTSSRMKNASALAPLC